jgi:hypothetical protein
MSHDKFEPDYFQGFQDREVPSGAPTRQELNDLMKEYTAKGGTVTRLRFTDHTQTKYINEFNPWFGDRKNLRRIESIFEE